MSSINYLLYQFNLLLMQDVMILSAQIMLKFCITIRWVGKNMVFLSIEASWIINLLGGKLPNHFQLILLVHLFRDPLRTMHACTCACKSCPLHLLASGLSKSLSSTAPSGKISYQQQLLVQLAYRSMENLSDEWWTLVPLVSRSLAA